MWMNETVDLWNLLHPTRPQGFLFAVLAFFSYQCSIIPAHHLLSSYETLLVVATLMGFKILEHQPYYHTAPQGYFTLWTWSRKTSSRKWQGTKQRNPFPNSSTIYLHIMAKDEFGIGGRKPAKDFTARERDRVKYNFHRRKVVWDQISLMVRAGFTAHVGVFQQ